jgi:hypothetical protein
MMLSEFEYANELANFMISSGTDPHSQVYILFVGHSVYESERPHDLPPLIAGFSHPRDPHSLSVTVKGRPRHYRLGDLANRKNAQAVVEEQLHRIPFVHTDAETIAQLGARVVIGSSQGIRQAFFQHPSTPTAEERVLKSITLWRAMVDAFCHKRDLQDTELSLDWVKHNLALDKIERLYLQAHNESIRSGEWAEGLLGIKAYLETGLPVYRVKKLLAGLQQDPISQAAHHNNTSVLMPALIHLEGLLHRGDFPLTVEVAAEDACGVTQTVVDRQSVKST